MVTQSLNVTDNTTDLKTIDLDRSAKSVLRLSAFDRLLDTFGVK